MSKFTIRPVGCGLKFDLRASNGEPVATSEVYETRASCMRGVESVRRNAAAAPLEDLTCAGTAVKNPKFQLYADKAGAYRFRLRARNGEIIASSGAYTTRAACLGGIESVRANAPAAEAVFLEAE